MLQKPYGNINIVALEKLITTKSEKMFSSIHSSDVIIILFRK